jgi:hypothetical protein
MEPDPSSASVPQTTQTSSGPEENKKREAFGNRHLTGEQNVFDFNAWLVFFTHFFFE